MQRHPDYTRTRLRQLAERMRKKIYSDTLEVPSIEVAGPVERSSYAQAQQLKGFRRARVGDQLGPLWATFWFRCQASVPRAWAGRRVDLWWASHSEATLWVNGRSVQGLNYDPASWGAPTRPEAVLVPKARGGEKLAFQVEVACNGLFGDPGQRGPYSVKAVSPFVFEACELRAFDPLAWKLAYDYGLLVDLEAESERGLDPSWAGELLFELNRVANVYDPDDRSTWNAAAGILAPLLARRNAARTHEMSAVGHAHIDTAWLWPLAETWRKCERTFSTQTAYMDDYPAYKFACSQAYQYEVIRERNPDLYRRIIERAQRGQWVPAGGTWIEPDCNIPSGEALVRQFLYGQRYFERELGRRCREFWNPDVFGYNGQLPQIMRGAGIRRFLTQKLSWNRFTKPPHHTFTWQGIDGSEVLAHFPPADTYNADASVKEVRHNVRNYKDHDRSRESYYLFGHGDGGGGPTRHMIENLSRMADLQGLPRVAFRTPDEFFTRLERDCPDLPTIVGELYFELHRGTYTSQAAVKRGNRRSELLMHDVEFLHAARWALARRAKIDPPADAPDGWAYPHAAIDEAWKVVLLNQFHDILPGSSITQVYDDAALHYVQVDRAGRNLRESALRDVMALTRSPEPAAGRRIVPVNTIGFTRREVVAQPDGTLGFAEAPAYGLGALVEPPDRVSITATARGWVLENARLRATLTRAGRIGSLIEKSTGREALAGEGNVFQLFDDRPTAWDAWDVDPFHLETRRDCGPARKSKVLSKSPLRAEVQFEHPIGKSSTLVQVIRLDAGSGRVEVHCRVKWQENARMLKVAFPVNARAMNATYEMQFGCVERPTHFSNPGDLAKYEVPMHRWFDLGEHGFGVAVLNDCKYGGSVLGNVMRLSLLRAPSYPDPTADRGEHAFAYAIFPHAGGWREAGVVAEAARFNAPLLLAPGRSEAGRSLAAVDSADLVLDTIKKAEDDNSLILRLYECHGARGTARLRLGVPFRDARYCNLLEDRGTAVRVVSSGPDGGEIELPYRPFEIISLKVR